MLTGVGRRAAFSRAIPGTALQRQSLLVLPRFRPRPSIPLILRHHQHVSHKEQRRKDWMVVRQLIGNVWPEHDWNTRCRVVFGFALLISGKVPLYLHPVHDFAFTFLTRS